MRFPYLAAVVVLAWGSVAQLMHASAGGAGVLYASDITPLLDRQGGTSIGSLAPGAALTVVAQSGDSVQVTISGWSTAKDPATIYASPNRRIVQVTGLGGGARFGAEQQVGGVTYRATSVDGWVSMNALATDPKAVLSKAQQAYSQLCSSCHVLQPPSTFSANEWPDAIKNHSPNPGLSPSETALVTFYLQTESPK